MKRVAWVVAATLALGLAWIWVVAGEPVKQQTCPPCRQSLESFGHELHVTHMGQRVYVCCAGCAVKMQRDWDGYVSILAELGKQPETLTEPEIHNPSGRGVCEACAGGACEIEEHKPGYKP